VLLVLLASVPTTATSSWFNSGKGDVDLISSNRLAGDGGSPPLGGGVASGAVVETLLAPPPPLLRNRRVDELELG